MSISRGLKCSGLEVRRDKQQVLTDVGFSLAPGELVAMIGRNGSGKTTFLEALAGIIPFSRGSVTFDGETVDRLPPYRRRKRGMVFVPDRGHVFNNLTVNDNIAVVARESSVARRDLIHAFPRFEDKLNQYAGSLSGGEKRILCIHSAVASKPRLLIVDEFSEGLQKQFVESLLGSIKGACIEGASALLVVHSRDFAREHGLPVARVENRRLLME